MSDPIRIGGFFSSFDTEAIIEKLTEIRQLRIRRLDVDQARADARKAGIADLSSKFATLLARVNTLSNLSSVSGKTASVSGSGVTASASAGAATGSFTVDVVKLASGTKATGSAISAGVDSVSLLNASNLTTAVTSGNFTVNGTTIAVDITADSLDDVVARINANVAGVTATIENDANGRPNILKLTSAGTITLGSGADTSNFLSATNLLASPGTTTRESTLSIARLVPTEKMSTADWFGGVPAAGDHTFTINGVSIAYNTATDSLNDVLARINSSAAGVIARYDSVSDTVSLEQTKFGSFGITLADDGAGGDFLSKTGLLAAAQTLGSNAEYKIDGGTTQYASTNSVSVNGGVTLNFTALSNGSPATVTVGQDSSAAAASIRSFVTEFNNVANALDAITKADGSKEDAKPGLLSGDASIRQLKSTLRSLVTSPGLNLGGTYENLGQVGISFGAYGSALGSTNTLQFDESKFKEALSKDPTGIQNLFSAWSLDAALAGGGTGSIASMSGTYTGSKAGSYAITDDGAGNLSAVFTPSDGSTPTTTTATVVAAGTNTTLIPGMTLTIAGAFQAGTHTITVSPTKSSVFRQIKDFLENQAGAGGMLSKRQDSYAAVSKDIADRKLKIQDHIDAEMDVLRKKFIAMEQAQARASSVLSALQQAMTKMAANQ